MKPLYIFDLDGTLADINHRKYLIDPTKLINWDAFYLACVNDSPFVNVIKTLTLLINSGAEIWFYSGRGEIARDNTLDWLVHYIPLPRSIIDSTLMMRPDGDYTPDEILKYQWLEQSLLEDRERLVAVFDDRDKVVKMWRDNGVTCFQVNYGNF